MLVRASDAHVHAENDLWPCLSIASTQHRQAGRHYALPLVLGGGKNARASLDLPDPAHTAHNLRLTLHTNIVMAHAQETYDASKPVFDKIIKSFTVREVEQP